MPTPPRPKDMSFFRDLIWPAAAGSVFWGFFCLLIDPHLADHIKEDLDYRIFVLGFLTLYLCFDWWESDWNVNMSIKRFCGNLAHIVSIVVFAIGMVTGRGELWLWISLMAVLSIATTGNLLGVWGPDKPLILTSTQNLVETLPNVVGLVVLLGIYFYTEKPLVTHLSVASAITIIAYVLLGIARRCKPSFFQPQKEKVPHVT